MQAPTPTPRHASPVPPARSWRRYAMRWRARWSIPALLARREESGVVSLAAAVNAIIAILGISLIAWLLDMPVLFPALGPSAFLLFSQPFSTAAAPRQVVVGHAVGMLTGLATWHARARIEMEDAEISHRCWSGPQDRRLGKRAGLWRGQSRCSPPKP
jgi:hypothetical protein